MKIKRFVVGMLETNAYIVYDETSHEALVIDPGCEMRKMSDFIDRSFLRLKGIVLTHCHYDHIGAVSGLKKKYEAPVYAHKKEVRCLADPNINHSAYSNGKPVSISVDCALSDGDTIAVEGLALQVIHTPGHTPGGMCLKVVGEDIIFTGDTIFSDDIGRMDLEGGSEDSMKKSLMNKASKWPGETVIYPGHGESATMDEVRKRNAEYIYMTK